MCARDGPTRFRSQQRIIERGEGFAQQADYARDVIAENAGPFLRDGARRRFDHRLTIV